QQSWLSPAFPTGSYSYSHGIEWAVEAGYIHDRNSLVDWLEADLCYGSGRNEAIFFMEAWRSATDDDCEKLLEIAELAAAFRGTCGVCVETIQAATRLPRHIAPGVARCRCRNCFTFTLGTQHCAGVIGRSRSSRSQTRHSCHPGPARLSAKLP